MAKKEEPKKKTKRPTAQKRDIRNENRRQINKAFKSEARTALRSFETALQEGETSKIKSALKDVYSTVDKGVKRGLYKPNKANRVKARASAKAAAQANS